ncbi:MAG: polymer-forming cytoskeletal protein, partial [Flavobacteriaceae bacterium]|nr:polymer-forming cytoskeletal protein [Flavobacteriaceae bacterium]
QNRINEGTHLKGDIVSSGFFRIDGKIEGSITNPSKVVLGKTGVIIGKMTCENADIEGRFEGSLDVSGTLTLKPSAHIDGEVIVGKLAVEPGAVFNASCLMRGSEKAKNTQLGTATVKEVEPAKAQNHPFDRQQRLKKPAAEQAE